MIMTAIRTIILYFVVIICMRIMGKRQVGELQPSEFVVTILISELASIPIQDLNRPITNGILAIFLLVVLELLLSFAILKSDFLRKLFEGKSATIIKNGVVDQKKMKDLRITIDDLLEGLRQSGNFSIDTVDIAIMETNGRISVQPKANFQPPQRQDLKIKSADKGLPILLISDGKIVEEACQSISKIEILKELKSRNLMVQNVFLMTVNALGEFVVIRKE